MNNIIAIDIGGSSVKYGKVDVLGNILSSKSIIVDNENIESFLFSLITLVQENRDDDTFAIAISSPGSVDSENKIVRGVSAVSCIHHNNWIERLEQATNLNASVLNDANCALLAETWIGNAKGCDSAISLVLGTGLGGSIFLNEKIITGSNLYGGEFGYMLTMQEGKLVCYTQLVSTAALVGQVKDAGYQVSNGIDVFALVEQNIKEVVEIVENYYYQLALIVYNLQHSLDPKIILIGGAISNREDMVSKIKYYYNQIMAELKMSGIDVNIKRCKFSNESNLLGAVKFYLNTNS